MSDGMLPVTLPLTNIVGERVALGPLRSELLPMYTGWRNDFSTAVNMDRTPRPITIEERASWFDRVIADPTCVMFTIYLVETWRPIGIGNLHDLDFAHGTAELEIIIGEAVARGRGFGTEAVRLLLDYAFTAAGLHNVMLRVYAYNVGGIRAYQKAGFREIGRRRDCRRHAGRRWDEVCMECLASDFDSPVLMRSFTSES